MKVTTICIITTTITVAIITTLLISNKEHEPLDPSQASDPDFLGKRELVSKRVSRFLEQKIDGRYRRRNPVAADHCHKDYEVCESLYGGRNATCCNNKCVDLRFDSGSCGSCKKKCLFTQVCCNGECVDTAYDKRHCGRCSNKCFRGQYCIYGMCDYA